MILQDQVYSSPMCCKGRVIELESRWQKTTLPVDSWGTKKQKQESMNLFQPK